MLGSGVSPRVIARAARINPAWSKKLTKIDTAVSANDNANPRNTLLELPCRTCEMMLMTNWTAKMISTITMIWPMYCTNLFQP